MFQRDDALTRELPPAIIIGGGSANGLGIARNLGRRGIPIYCVTSDPYEITCVSRYCSGAMVIPDVEDNPTLLRRALVQLSCQVPEHSVLFPTSDTAVLTLSQIRDQLDHYVTYIADRSVVETMIIKTQFYPSLEAHGVPHPQTFYPSHESVTSITEKLQFPVYVRPAQPLVFGRYFHGKGFVATSIQDLRCTLSKVQQVGVQVMVQEVIPGPTTEGYIFQGYFDQRSQPIVIVAAQKLRQRSMFSNQSIHVSIPPSWVEECTRYLVEYFQRIGYRGLFGAEFKRDPRDRQFKLLEVNARSMGGNCFETACGANDILAAYRDVLGYEVTPMLMYDTGVYFIDEFQDMKAIPRLLLQRQLSYHDLLYPFRAKKKIFNYWARDDVAPWRMQMFKMFRDFIHIVKS